MIIRDFTSKNLFVLKMIVGYEIKAKLEDTIDNQLYVERLFYPGGVPIITMNILASIKETKSFKQYKAANESACIKEMKKREQAWNKQQQASSVSLAKTVLELCQLHLNYQIESGELKQKSIDRCECTINQIAKEPFGRLLRP